MHDQGLTTLTNTTLLQGLRRGDPTAWQSYVDRYRPLILRCVQRVGLSVDDAEDVTQTSLVAFCESYAQGKYDRSKGRLRSWLFGIVHNQVRQHFKTRDRMNAAPLESALQSQDPSLVAEDELRELWEDEWNQSILRQCLLEVRREVQETSFEAFRLFAIEGVSAEETAKRLGTTPNAVFLGKRRILARIREIAKLMEDIW